MIGTTAQLGPSAPVPAPPSAPPARPMTQHEAAAAYAIPLRTLRRLTRVRAVPSYVLGRNRMVFAADLEAYLGRCKDTGRPVGTVFERPL